MKAKRLVALLMAIMLIVGIVSIPASNDKEVNPSGVAS